MKLKQIIVDTREKTKAIENLTQQIEEQGYETIRTKLPVGDYRLTSNFFYAVDRKQNIQELIGNVTHDHERFKAELDRAKHMGVFVTVLIEDSSAIKCIDDLRYWRNPRLKVSPRATTGETLIRILRTMEHDYDVEFLFCSKKETGYRIVELLEKGVEEHG